MCRMDDVVTQNPEVMWKRLGTQIVTLNMKTRQYHVLNDAAAFIFEHATGKNTVEVISGDLGKRFKVAKARAQEDARETVDGMVRLGLLVGASAGPPRKGGYERPAIREVTEGDFRGAIAEGAELACRSLLGA